MLRLMGSWSAPVFLNRRIEPRHALTPVIISVPVRHSHTLLRFVSASIHEKLTCGLRVKNSIYRNLNSIESH